MFNLRGEVVPVFDTASLLGVGCIAIVRFVVVVDTPDGPAGLVASALPRVVQLEDPVGPSELFGTLGMHMFAGGVAVLLDIQALLQATSTRSGSVR